MPAGRPTRTRSIPRFAELFGALNDDARAVLEDATGASWAPHHRADEDDTAPPAAVARRRPRPLPGGRPPPRSPASRSAPPPSPRLRALMLIRSYRVRGHLEARLDPLGLQIPTPHAELDPRSLWLHRRRPRPADLHRQRAGPRDRDAARNPDHPARDLLRLDRRRVHAHPGPGPEGLDPAQGGRRALAHRVRRHGQAQHPARSSPRPRASRCSARSATSPPSGSAWRAARSPSRRCTPSSRRWRRAGVSEIAIGMPHRGRLNTLVNIVKKPLTAVFSRIRRRELQAGRRAGFGRREIPPRHLDRRGDRRAQRASVAAAQPVASGGGRSGRGRQGARAAGQGGRHAAPLAR